METDLYATRHNNKISTSPSLLLLITPPLEETKSSTVSPLAAMAAFLSYLSPFPSSSSNSNKNKSKDRKNLRLADSTDPMLMMSPRIGCMGQIKSSKHGAKKGKRKESGLLVRFLAPLFKGSSKVRDVPRSVKIVSITEMDPPLPVKMRSREDDLYKVSLWERRFGVKEIQKLVLKENRRQLATTTEIHVFGN
ncbi:S-adenosylmethionine decarboxylase proenzyme [Rhynchospora pubera]|uniref:S-adenosylmethionine decarboxylase proenzyme n=1 Tax=Rhynchospora pubera TaxID=906938 RepID=A0AAV8D8C7_9POAL|nr:S-adenosylmethionine decarboxylase proenzyme [Rhynchospora pubera]